MTFLDELGDRAARTGKRVVLVEGADDRVKQAAARLAGQLGLETVVLVPDAETARSYDAAVDTRIPGDEPDRERYIQTYRESRAEDPSAAAIEEALRDPLVLAALMVANGAVDGAVAGAATSTATVVRAGLRFLGPAEGVRTVSGAFYMIVPPFRAGGDTEVLTFTDSGVVPDPGTDQLVEIAAQAARYRRSIVGDEPRVAFLSYSTRGSAGGASVKKVRGAVERFRLVHPDVPADGELQADAALIEEVGHRKAPDSPVAGRANVLVFPDLDAGNIAYKLVERLAGATAIGPILHGLRRPLNDLSRGARVEGIVGVACVTALMAAALDS